MKNFIEQAAKIIRKPPVRLVVQVLAVLGLGGCLLITSGCGIVPGTRTDWTGYFPTDVTIKVVDQQTGEPLREGYAFVETKYARLGLLDYPHAPTTSEGPQWVKKIGEDGKIEVPSRGYHWLRAIVYVKGYATDSWDYTREAQFSSHFKTIEGPGTLKLKDITSDSEGWEDKIEEFAAEFRLLEGKVSEESRDKVKKYLIEEYDYFASEHKPHPILKSDFRELKAQSSDFEKLYSFKTQIDDWPERSNIRIAILDSGVPKNNLETTCFKTPENLTNTKTPYDIFGHGTYTTGIISGVYDSLKLPMKILPIKVLNNQGEGQPEQVARGIKTALKREPDVIFIGAGTRISSQKLRNAIIKANNSGALIIAPYKNNSPNLTFYPASYEGVIGVDKKKISSFEFSRLKPDRDLFHLNDNSGVAAFATRYVAYLLDNGLNAENIRRKLSSPSKKSSDNSKTKNTKQLLKAQWKENTHREITRASLTKSIHEKIEQPIGSRIYREITKDYTAQLLQGNKQEDLYGGGQGDGIDDLDWGSTPLYAYPRFSNHFFHWDTEKQLTSGDVTINVQEDARDWLFNSPKIMNWYRWEDAIKRYGYTEDAKEAAYRTLGFAAHMFQDMYVPMHVHDDPHPGDYPGNYKYDFPKLEEHAKKNIPLEPRRLKVSKNNG